MPDDGTLEIRVTIGRLTSTRADWGFYTVSTRPPSQGLEYQYWSYAMLDRLGDNSIALKFEHAESHLVEMGAFCEDVNVDSEGPLELCQVLNITIRPKSPAPLVWSIKEVRMTKRENAVAIQNRLTWTWSGMHDSNPLGLPWSKTTGPFSHFVVICGGRELGRAYCTEFPLQQSDFGHCEWEGEDVEFVIDGILFGGGKISSGPVSIAGFQAMLA